MKVLMHNKQIILILMLHFTNMLMSMEITPKETMSSQKWHLDKTFSHKQPVYSAYFDGQRLVTASKDGKARIFDVNTQQEIACFEYDIYQVGGVYLSSAQKDIISMCGNAKNLKQKENMFNAQIEQKIDSIEFKPFKEYFVYHKIENLWTPQEHCNVYIEEKSTQKMLATVQHDAYVHDISLDPSGKYLTTASDDGNVRIFKRHDEK